MKEKVKEKIELAFPDYHPSVQGLEHWVNASKTGEGAYLIQMQDSELRMIAFASMPF